ncbi:MAG: hypothetical protein A3C61_00390 [Candidatus Yanofskybacteria bacterium RIFCSPHIGHO2_02_FULL_39_10]|uniref:1-deoxy-D-xylulose-5-phosphate synthase n=1 Tax=Candidatus Yanofskybacteria bacterium RIFCSPHIGHO2_02_FULL_39_10 TaxID=1802674 RepID=A0A1F8F9Y9_9BACT|nr:MAG: hypothetical protein A3C61_00390 [Candidatus Yanofskybacteria bacterium RIFCSPHIGHO2_02_FULL_39_10]
MEVNKTDIRDAFFDEIYEIGKADRNMLFLTDDMDAFGLRKFVRDFPVQFINIGVAEQNQVNVATGLTLCGKKVFIFGICSFMTMRCFEQIKFNICGMNLPVVVVGVGAGFSFDSDGPALHGTQDIAIMRSLPEMTIYNPPDAMSASAVARLAYEKDGPSYIRLDKGVYPVIYENKHELQNGFKVVRSVQAVNIISTGYMTSVAIRLVEELEKQGVNVGLLDLMRLKPVDPLFYKTIENTESLITIEENSLIGGLGSIVGELLIDNDSDIKLKRIGSQDRQFIVYGTRDWLQYLNELTLSDLQNTILNWLRRGN